VSEKARAGGNKVLFRAASSGVSDTGLVSGGRVR